MTNCRVVNVFSLTIDQANIAIRNGRIAGIGPYTNAHNTIDLKGSFVAPGFIDAHMHVESTFLPPSQFVQLAIPRGTTGAVFDPHEIANVMGIAGIRFVMHDCIGLPFSAMFALSSCVPASHLETSGARLSAADLEPLFEEPGVVALAEMMNFPGVVAADQEVLAKIALGLRHHVVDGHAPGLRGQKLQAYAAAGISSDHECTTASEAAEKLALGMQIFIREGSAARNLEALVPLITDRTWTRFCFCTDDRHPADLAAYEGGHIDHVVRCAIRLGVDPLLAIATGSYNVARHYRRDDLGAIAPGRLANLIVFDDLSDPRPRLVFHQGQLAASEGRYQGPQRTVDSNAVRSTVTLHAALNEQSFEIPARARGMLRVIGMDPHQLTTAHLTMEASIQQTPRGSFAAADPKRDLLKLAVIERHRGTGNIGLGFVQGFKLQRGAIASTVGHDSHNLAVVGVNDRDMLAAAHALEEVGGGQCAVENGRVLAMLPLRIGGLMSDQPAHTVMAQQAALLKATHDLGCPHHDPFMPLSFLPLPVIPRLKLTDKGLVDVDRFELVDLWV